MPDPQELIDVEVAKLKLWFEGILGDQKEILSLETKSAVDNLGEEIASDINTLEIQHKNAAQQLEQLSNQLKTFHTELKMT